MKRYWRVVDGKVESVLARPKPSGGWMVKTGMRRIDVEGPLYEAEVEAKADVEKGHARGND